MRRTHRIAHRFLWPTIAAAVLFGLLMALHLRPPPPPPPPQAQESGQ